jgi:hypothetical protein
MQSKKRSQISWHDIHVYTDRTVEYATERPNIYKYWNKHVRRSPPAASGNSNNRHVFHYKLTAFLQIWWLQTARWFCNWQRDVFRRSSCVRKFVFYGAQRTENKTTDVVIHQHSRKLLMMDILMSETCWARKKWNKIASDIKLVFHSSTKITLSLFLQKRREYN